MDNFDKLFNDKLNEITENDFEFKESSWERFQNEWTEESKVEKPAVLPLWLKRNAVAAAVVGLLLLSNVFFAQQVLSTRSDIKKLNTTVEELQKSVTTCSEQSDNYSEIITDLKVKMAEQAQLINNQKALIETQNERLMTQSRMSLMPVFPNQNGFISNKNNNNSIDNFNNQLNNNDKNSTTSTVNNNGTNAAPASELTIGEKPKKMSKNEGKNEGKNNSNDDLNQVVDNNSITKENTTASSPNKSETNENEMVNTTKEMVLLDKKTIVLGDFSKNIDLKKRPIPVVENEYKPDFATRMYMLKEAAKPSAYQVGLASKYTYLPTVSGLSPMRITNNGVVANALFFNNFRLQIGAEYWLSTFEAEDIENMADGTITPILDAYPTILPTSPLDELTKIESSTNGFDFPLSAQILLRPKKSFNPYVGFGLVGRYTNNYSAEHYFIDNATSYEYESKNETAVQRLDIGMWQSQLGMDYQVFDNWLVNVEINYLRSFKAPIFGLTDIQQYGASLGIKYEF